MTIPLLVNRQLSLNAANKIWRVAIYPDYRKSVLPTLLINDRFENQFFNLACLLDRQTLIS
jgi:hypothetical protein